MIKNNKQLTKAKDSYKNYDKFIEQELEDLKKSGAHSVEIELRYNILNAQKEKLRLEIQEYENLLICDEISIQDIYDLPNSIIKARLRTGFSQKDLAQKIDVAEQQIQRYEAQGYNKANLERVVQIIDALEMEVSMSFKPRIKTKIISLEDLGVNMEHLKERKDASIQTKSLMLIGN